MKNLYTINNDIIKNEDSKSLILTPYNTFLSESDYNDEDNLDFKTENDINLMVKWKNIIFFMILIKKKLIMEW